MSMGLYHLKIMNAMKNIMLMIVMLSTVFFYGCEGPVGPIGPKGDQGSDGAPGPESIVFDIQGNLNAQNEYSLYYEFPQSIEVFESDAVLVYRLWGQQEIPGDAPADVWRLMPITAFVNNGMIQYSFDHTFIDLSIFLDGNVPLANLGNNWLNNQVFRVVIIPGYMADNRRVNLDEFKDYNALKKQFNLKDDQITRVSATQK